MRLQLSLGALSLALLSTVVQGEDASPSAIESPDATKHTAKVLAEKVLTHYHGNEIGETLGLLPYPRYYWYNSAVLWQTLIEYWHYTGDSSYNSLVMQSLLSQVGAKTDYAPDNQTLYLSNDDQAFWGLAALLAAERDFPNPPADKPQWLQLAENVFDAIASRWDTGHCDGGLRWQIDPYNKGYDYKDSLSNGGLFNLAARLARYTGNQTYVDWADKAWDWVSTHNLMNNQTHAIYGGVFLPNCTVVDKVQMTYTNGIYVLGAASLYNSTNGDDKWKGRLDNLLDHGTDYFFTDGVVFEPLCQPIRNCVTDQISFKGLLHQWYAMASQLAPYTSDLIRPLLASSAKAAVERCDGQSSCSYDWLNGTKTPMENVNKELSVLAAVSGLLVDSASAPFTSKNGGTARGNNGNADGGKSGDKSGDKGTKSGDKKSDAYRYGLGASAIITLVASIAGAVAL